MAIFRKIHTTFWSDSFIQDLDNDKKLFYLYLLTNERTKQCGIYEITKKQIGYDLSMNIKLVESMLKFFISKGKIRYNESTFELAIGNWLKFNNSTSPKVQSCINKEFTYCKDTLLIEYVKSMDTLSQQEEEEKEEEKQDIKKPRKIKFEDSELFDKFKFKEHFPDWSKEKLAHYYDAALRYSIEGNKYVSWELAIKSWERKDVANKVVIDKPKEKVIIW